MLANFNLFEFSAADLEKGLLNANDCSIRKEKINLKIVTTTTKGSKLVEIKLYFSLLNCPAH